MKVVIAHNRYVSANPSGENTVVDAEMALLAEAGVEVLPFVRSSDEIAGLRPARKALLPVYPELARMELTDFKVRILDTTHGTDAITRVLIEHADRTSTWETVGIGANIVEASWHALVDALTYAVRHRSR